MNKTTEALKLAEEALERLEQIDGVYSWGHVQEAVREALAEKIPEWVDVDDYEEPVKHSERYWLHEINNARADGYERGYMAAKKLYAEPVKQEPVAWLFQHEETGRTLCVDVQQVQWNFEKNNPRLQKIHPLYAAPVDAKAIREERDSMWLAQMEFEEKRVRAEALEEAAKVCDDYENRLEGMRDEDYQCEIAGRQMGAKRCAAAIRGLK
jgi:hypothetical protein